MAILSITITTMMKIHQIPKFNPQLFHLLMKKYSKVKKIIRLNYKKALIYLK